MVSHTYIRLHMDLLKAALRMVTIKGAFIIANFYAEMRNRYRNRRDADIQELTDEK